MIIHKIFFEVSKKKYLLEKTTFYENEYFDEF